MYEAEDQNEIVRLQRVVTATRGDCDIIYNLYKKYINNNALMYQTNCNCNTSISRYYQTLLDWYSSNSSRFIPKGFIFDEETQDFIAVYDEEKIYTSEGILIKKGQTLD